jgi:hypothetical protein
MPSLESWLRDAVADAERSDQQGVRPVLDAIAAAAKQVRQGAWNADASTSEDRLTTAPQSIHGPRG